MADVREVWGAEDAAREIGISYQALARLIRSGKAAAKKMGLGLTNPWRLHVTEVRRLKEIYSDPPAAISVQAAG